MIGLPFFLNQPYDMADTSGQVVLSPREVGAENLKDILPKLVDTLGLK